MKTQRQREKTEAKIGVMLSQVKEGLRLPETERGKEGSSSRGSEGSMALPTFEFGPLVSKTVKQ